jgi:hypothetical protein
MDPFDLKATKKLPGRISDPVDIAARYLVYKLYDATDGVRDAWHALAKSAERPATVARAVERGWIILREGGTGKDTPTSASLTNEGRLLARKG